jgi:hypothetical protein
VLKICCWSDFIPKFYFHIILINCIFILECVALLHKCMYVTASVNYQGTLDNFFKNIFSLLLSPIFLLFFNLNKLKLNNFHKIELSNIWGKIEENRFYESLFGCLFSKHVLQPWRGVWLVVLKTKSRKTKIRRNTKIGNNFNLFWKQFWYFFRNNCTTGLWGWTKLRITLCGTKSSWRVFVVNYNYELLPKPVFRPPSSQNLLACHVI